MFPAVKRTRLVSRYFSRMARLPSEDEEDSCLLFSTFDVLRSADMEAMGGVVAGKVHAYLTRIRGAALLRYHPVQRSSSDRLNLGEDYSSEQSYFRHPASTQQRISRRGLCHGGSGCWRHGHAAVLEAQIPSNMTICNARMAGLCFRSWQGQSTSRRIAATCHINGQEPSQVLSTDSPPSARQRHPLATDVGV